MGIINANKDIKAIRISERSRIYRMFAGRIDKILSFEVKEEKDIYENL